MASAMPKYLPKEMSHSTSVSILSIFQERDHFPLAFSDPETHDHFTANGSGVGAIELATTWHLERCRRVFTDGKGPVNEANFCFILAMDRQDRKQATCSSCRRILHVGQRYVSVSGVKTHPPYGLVRRVALTAVSLKLIYVDTNHITRSVPSL